MSEWVASSFDHDADKDATAGIDGGEDNSCSFMWKCLPSTGPCDLWPDSSEVDDTSADDSLCFRLDID